MITTSAVARHSIRPVGDGKNITRFAMSSGFQYVAFIRATQAATVQVAG